MRLRLMNHLTVRLAACVLTLVFIASACQDSPQTEYLLEVTREVTRIVVVTATPEGTPAAQVDSQTVDAPTEEVITPEVTENGATISLVPTPITDQIIIAEQVFENGRMIWLQPRQEIWVMYDENNEWIIYEDTWQDGMPEFDPNLIIPEGLYQPMRGFGKLWRENDTVRNILGWAIAPEAGNVTTYTYVFEGGVNDEGTFVQEPGYHTITSYYGGAFIFDEANSTWRRAPDSDQ